MLRSFSLMPRWIHSSLRLFQCQINYQQPVISWYVHYAMLWKLLQTWVVFTGSQIAGWESDLQCWGESVEHHVEARAKLITVLTSHFSLWFTDLITTSLGKYITSRHVYLFSYKKFTTHLYTSQRCVLAPCEQTQISLHTLNKDLRRLGSSTLWDTHMFYLRCDELLFTRVLALIVVSLWEAIQK